jgi:hypothetical protein
MSEIIPPDDAQIARAAYDRMLDETRRFSAEQNKLAAEARTFRPERNTLAMTASAAILGAGAVIGGLLVRLLTGH